MSWTSIPDAHAYWQLNRRLPDPPPELEEAEMFILNEHPNTLEDTVRILDVVRAYSGDMRCDGLDHAALGRVRTFLAAVS